MNLNVSSWKEFKLARLVDVDYGNKFDNNKMTYDNPSINFVSRTAENNGVSDVVDKIPDVEPYEAGCMTIALGGSIGTCCVQTKPFYTGQNVAVLNTTHLSNNVKLFLSSLIMQESSIKYCAFGRELNKHIKTDFSIYLPIIYNEDGTPFVDSKSTYSDEGYLPDWQFMDDYIKSLHHKPLTTKKNISAAQTLNPNEWHEFIVSDLFDICGSTTTPKEVLEDIGFGKYPYVTTSASNNGIEGYYNHWTENGNIIVIESACMGFATYQPMNFSASDHVEKCIPKFHLTPELAQFLVTILNSEIYKFSYGRKCNQNRIKERVLRLPIVHHEDGAPYIDNEHKYSPDGYVPDWQFMEDYIKSLPYGDRLL